jgi:hypothetical protein
MVLTENGVRYFSFRQLHPYSTARQRGLFPFIWKDREAVRNHVTKRNFPWFVPWGHVTTTVIMHAQGHERTHTQELVLAD